jgi:hypothetical protein
MNFTNNHEGQVFLVKGSQEFKVRLETETIYKECTAQHLAPSTDFLVTGGALFGSGECSDGWKDKLGFQVWETTSTASHK